MKHFLYIYHKLWPTTRDNKTLDMFQNFLYFSCTHLWTISDLLHHKGLLRPLVIIIHTLDGFPPTWGSLKTLILNGNLSHIIVSNNTWGGLLCTMSLEGGKGMKL